MLVLASVIISGKYIWSKTHDDPTKRGNPNGGESEDTRITNEIGSHEESENTRITNKIVRQEDSEITRLNHRKAEKSGIHGTRARAIK